MSMVAARLPLRTSPVASAPSGRSGRSFPLMPQPMLRGDLACAGVDPEVFFPTSPEDLRLAQSTCGSCPVVVECARYGRQARLSGVWGGVLLERGSPTDELFPVERGPRTQE